MYSESTLAQNDAALLLQHLNDGWVHDKSAVVAALGWGPQRLDDALAGLAALGIEARGDADTLRINPPADLLDAAVLREQLTGLPLLGGVEVFFEIGSTNDYLLASAATLDPSAHVCLAEVQTKGRGRRGRGWISPLAANLYCSLLWRWKGTAGIGGLSLALGVAAAEALTEFGADEVGIKWPNDLYWGGRKLAGILVDLSGDPRRRCDVVAGIGINVDMRNRLEAGAINQPWCDLTEVLEGVPPRNEMAVALVRNWLRAFEAFEQEGMSAFLTRYARFDLCAHQVVTLATDTGSVDGIARGINRDGALLLERDGKLEAHVAADVSLRLPAPE